MLQQYLPLAVLKRINKILTFFLSHSWVATVLTACGIETPSNIKQHVCNILRLLQQYLPLAVLKHLYRFRDNDMLL